MSIVDSGERSTKAIYRRADRRIAKIFQAALEKALKNQSAFLQKIADIDSGKTIPPAFYDTPEKVLLWRQGYTRELMRQHQIVGRLLRELSAAGVDVAQVLNEAGIDAYITNRAFTVAQISQQLGDVHVSFSQYDKHQISILLDHSRSVFSKIAYKNLGANPAIVRRLQNEMAQSVMLGEDRDKLIKRLQAVTGQSHYQAQRVAQTERTRLQSQARADTLTEAAKLGVRTTKTWSARMVHTRDSHAALDGQTIPSDQRFANGLRFPGDPEGSAGEVINCQCVMIPGVVFDG